MKDYKNFMNKIFDYQVYQKNIYYLQKESDNILLSNTAQDL